MLVEITAGLNSLKSAADLVKGLSAIATQTAINDVKLTLQNHIFEAKEALSAANEAQTATLEVVRKLEQEIVRFKDWEADKQRYELKAIDRGSFAYMLKPGMENGEPPHWLCANCFNRRQKSFLQFKGQDRDKSGGRGITSTYGCDGCKGTVTVYYTRNPLTPWAPEQTA